MTLRAPPQVIVRLADEGVPVAAIARACQSPSDEVRLLLAHALEGGQIVSIPRYDWHPYQRGERGPIAATSDDDIALSCRHLFGLTRLQSLFLGVLIRRNEVPKTSLHSIIIRANPRKDKEQSIKMVDVVIYHLRRKIGKHELEIKTLHGDGYYMEPAMRRRAQELLGHGQASQTEDSVEAT